MSHRDQLSWRDRKKGPHDLIKAFKGLEGDYKLVIAGDAGHETELCAPFCAAFYDGLPIVLLEAMSYGLPVLVSDIPANKEVTLSAERYFRCGDVDDLKEKMGVLLEKGLSEEEQQEIRKNIEEKYNWDKIAAQTIEVYRKALA